MKVENKNKIRNRYHFSAPLVPAGFYHSCNAKIEKNLPSIDLNEALGLQNSKMYLVRVSGESMIDEHIYSGDLLLVEKTNDYHTGDIIIASLNGELTVKRLQEIDGKIYLIAANKSFL